MATRQIVETINGPQWQANRQWPMDAEAQRKNGLMAHPGLNKSIHPYGRSKRNLRKRSAKARYV